MSASRTLGYYQSSNGSRLFALQATRKFLQAGENIRLQVKLDAAIAEFKIASSLKLKYETQKKVNVRSRNDAVQIDAQLDAAVSNLYGLFRINANRPGKSHKQAVAQKFLDAVFTRGVSLITGSRYEEEHALVGALITEIEANHLPAIALFHAEDLLADLERVNREFGAALDVLDRKVVSYADVQAQRAKAEKLFNDVSFIIHGDYCDDEEKRTTLLQAIDDQDARTQSYIKRRHVVPEVDPTSGEVVEAEPEVEDTPSTPEVAAAAV